jgi:D-sedoheptulose 7-phosphate isomerase
MMIQDYIQTLITRYPDLSPCADDVRTTYDILRDTVHAGRKILVCGNGGSASDAEHIVGELMKGYMLKRPLPTNVRERLRGFFPDEGDYLADHLQGAIQAIALGSHTALTTAFANDVAPDMIFAQQVYGYGQPGDTLLALSTSGNSGNVVRAVQVACAMGLHTIALTGQSGGKLKTLCDVTIRVPSDRTPDIQERHLPIYHALCEALEAEFFE